MISNRGLFNRIAPGFWRVPECERLNKARKDSKMLLALSNKILLGKPQLPIIVDAEPRIAQKTNGEKKTVIICCNL